MFSLIALYFAHRRNALVAPIVPEAPAAVVTRTVMKARQAAQPIEAPALPLAA